MTPARKRVAELIDERDAVSADMARLTESISRLDEAQKVEAPIAAELGALDASETAAMTAWSRAPGDKEVPAPDVEKRSHLERKLAAARASAASARSAQSGMNAEVATLATKQGAIGKAINALAAEIVAEESLDPLLGEMREADAAFRAVRTRIELGRQFVLRQAETGHAPLFQWLERFHQRLTGLEEKPLDESAPGASASHWASLAQRLTQDPAAVLS